MDYKRNFQINVIRVSNSMEFQYSFAIYLCYTFDISYDDQLFFIIHCSPFRLINDTHIEINILTHFHSIDFCF